MEIGYVADHAIRIAAVRELLDRAYGKPKQSTEISGVGGGPIETAKVPTAEDHAQEVALILAETRAVIGNGHGGNGNGNGNGHH